MALIIKSSTLNRPQVGAEEEWCEYQPGVSLLIRGLRHRFVEIGIQANQEAQQQVHARYLAGDISALSQGKTAVEMHLSVLCGLVLADWKGVELENGEELPFSLDTAKAIVSDPDNLKLVEWIAAEAGRISREAHERAEAQLGKSSSGSNGKKKPEPKKATPAPSPDEMQ